MPIDWRFDKRRPPADCSLATLWVDGLPPPCLLLRADVPLAPEFGMATIARLNVTTAMTTVRIAEHKPTRFEEVVDNSVPASGPTLVVSIPFDLLAAGDPV